jgi:membrane protease YdiL (CAAX protease family)
LSDIAPEDGLPPEVTDAAAVPASTDGVASSGTVVRGLFRFSLEGRRTPALFVLGWLGVLLGLGSVVVGLLGGGMSGIALLVAGLALLVAGLVFLGGSQAAERAVAALAYVGPSPILVVVAAFAATLLVALVVGIPLGLFSAGLPKPLGDLIFGTLQAATFLLIVRVMVVGSGAISWADMGFGADLGRVLRAVLDGAMWALPVILGTAVLTAVLVPLVGAVPDSPLEATGTGPGLLLNLITGAIVAPVSEEVLFRGVAATAWARTAGPTAAIVRSSVLFALAHILSVGGTTFSQAAGLVVIAAVGRLPIALALGWVYLRTRSLWASIGLHATFNAVLIVVAELAAAGILHG